MNWIIESIILCFIFTLIIVPTTIDNPLSMVHGYPNDIYQKAIELGLVKEEQNRKSKKFIVKRILAIIVLGLIFGYIVYRFNHANTFLKGMLYAYILWTIVNWYDCIVIDWLWFCHSKKIIIPGTEGMKGYKDYLFHAKGSLQGMLIGIPCAIVAGILVSILSK